jgi:hypothetical protein
MGNAVRHAAARTTASGAVRLSASTTRTGRTDKTCALIMGRTGVPKPDDFWIESVKNQSTHPGQTSASRRRGKGTAN